MTTLFDGATWPANLADVKAAGAAGILGYLDGPNAITLARAQAAAAAGLLVGSIYERGAADVLNPALGFGYGADAKTKAQACGQPTWAPIYGGTADFDLQPGAQVTEFLKFLQGFGQGCAPYPAGMYGGFLACAVAAYVGVRWRFQAGAWSYGKVQAGIGILQTSQQTTVDGVALDVDIDEGVLAEHGLWTPGAPNPCPTRESVLAQYGPTWYTHYGFAPPPPGMVAYPEIMQCQVYGESFAAA
jgi:hypothetical protein